MIEWRQGRRGMEFSIMYTNVVLFSSLSLLQMKVDRPLQAEAPSSVYDIHRANTHLRNHLVGKY